MVAGGWVTVWVEPSQPLSPRCSPPCCWNLRSSRTMTLEQYNRPTTCRGGEITVDTSGGWAACAGWAVHGEGAGVVATGSGFIMLSQIRAPQPPPDHGGRGAVRAEVVRQHDGHGDE